MTIFPDLRIPGSPGVGQSDTARSPTMRQLDTSGFKEAELTAKTASTRPVRLANGEIVSFTRSALDDLIDQARSHFVPMTIEHLTLLPPVGIWDNGEIVRAEDGEDELILYGRYLKPLAPRADDPDVFGLIPADPPTADSVTVDHVNLVARNYEPEDFAAIRESAPVPVEEEERWSVLPPLEVVFVISVVWGAIKFAGGFFEALGQETAHALVSWIGRATEAAKEPERDRLVTLQFELPSESETHPPVIYAFILIRADEDASAVALPALSGATPVAELAGAQAELGVLGDLERAAFIWDGSEWHLAWFVPNREVVCVTNWYRAHEPDVTGLLGRPLLELDPGDAKQET